MCEKESNLIDTFFAVPSAAPTLIYTHEFTSFSVTLRWDSVDCIEQNGNIRGYSLRYSAEESETIKTVYVSGGATTKTTIYGLNPSTKYFIEVAAVNSAGTGVYSTTIIITTKGILFSICLATMLKHSIYMPIHSMTKIAYCHSFFFLQSR